MFPSSLVLLSFLSIFSCSVSVSSRSFTVDYTNGVFLKDGHSFRYISGTLHYFQIPRELWRDRMLRMRALGCNVLQTYVLWSKHQLNENLNFDFSSDANVTEYLILAKQLGFSVILRLGPYSDAEQDLGGFPSWLLKKEGILLRSSRDARYLNAVQKWFDFLLPNIVKPLLYSNGGPIIMAQIENEFGSTYRSGCDHKYMLWMKELTERHLKNETLLITTDGPTPELIACGTLPGVFPTIDFGIESKKQVDQWFSNLRTILPHGPFVNSEFYPGWFDEWGSAKHATTPTAQVLSTMKYMWNWNVTSFNIYPVHGGTNWGYQAGGEGPPFHTVTTGYDFDAPISEAGDTTPKFLAMRELIQNLTERKIPYPIPTSPVKHAYGNVRMEWLGTVLDLITTLTPPDRIVHSEYPLTMEQVDQAYGFMVYQTSLPKGKGRLEITGVHDRAYVIVAGELVKVIQRGVGKPNTIFHISRTQRQISTGDNLKLHILVENQGRICYGPQMNDPKGLLANVTLDDNILTNWTIYPIDLSRIHKLSLLEVKKLIRNRNKIGSAKYLPSIYYGAFFANPVPADTFFDPTGWGKGQLFINGRNIGRYWPQAGPQITLYVPGVYLDQGGRFNQMYVFELDQPGKCDNDNDGCSIQFIEKPKYTKI